MIYVWSRVVMSQFQNIGSLALEEMKDFPLQAAQNIGLEGLLQRILKQTCL